MESLKTKLLSAANTNDLPSLERILTTVKLIAETEKTESEKEKVDFDKSRGGLELENLRRQVQLERVRLWLPLTVPAASAVLLAALTIVFQVYQLKKTTDLQRVTAEQATKMQQDMGWDAQWRGAIQTVADAKTPDATVAGLTFLAIFSKSDRYREPAHRLVLQYLAQAQEPNVFKTLCSIAFDKVNWNDFDEIVAMNLSMSDRYQVPYYQLKNPKTENRAKLQADVVNLKQNIEFLNSKLVAALKNRPSSASLNLDNLSLFDSNLKGVDFRSSSIRFTSFAGSDVTGADFSDVQNFEGAYWDDVAWWKAKSLSESLLSDLKSRFPFKEPRNLYGAVSTNAEDYNTNVARLSAQLGRLPAR